MAFLHKKRTECFILLEISTNLLHKLGKKKKIDNFMTLFSCFFKQYKV